MFNALIEKSGVDKTDDPTALPNCKESLILMNPTTMNSYGFVKGRYVLVGSERGEMLLKCWPCATLSPSSVKLPGLSLLQNNSMSNVTVKTFHGTTDCAKEVILVPKVHKHFMDSNVFKAFILKKIEKIHLMEETTLSFVFCGCQCEMIVVKLAGLSSKNNDYKIDDICDNMENLSVTNTQEGSMVCKQEFNRVEFDCSTPKNEKKLSHKRHFKSILNKEVLNVSNRFFQIISTTVINVQNLQRNDNTFLSKIKFQNIGGLVNQIKEIKHIMNIFLAHNKVKENFVPYQRSILISGPQGTGKSAVITAIQNEYKLPMYSVNSFEILNKYDTTGEEKFKSIFSQGIESAPSIILIDNVDVFCNKHKNATNALDNLSTFIEEAQNHDVFLIFTTNKPHLLDPNLLKQHIIGKELKFDIPSTPEREEILTKLLLKMNHSMSEDQVIAISESCHGFTGADIETLCKKADLLASLRNQPFSKYHKSSTRINYDDMKKCLKTITPHAVTEFQFEKPKSVALLYNVRTLYSIDMFHIYAVQSSINVKWSDIGGMQEVKRAIVEMVEWPLKHAEQFMRFKITPSRGILMYGPPGCSKTMIAKALVSESDFNFIPIKGPQLFNKYVGESEKAVSELFKKARAAAPCVIFFDEIDSLASKRGSSMGNSNVGDRVLTQLLTEIDGIDVLKGVCIIAATNRPDMIDPSLLRPGRFDRRIYVPLPDYQTRKEIFEVKISKMPLSNDVDLSHLVQATSGYTGAEIDDICREAVYQMAPWKFSVEDIPKLDMSHFQAALNVVTPRTTKDTIQFYESYSMKNTNKF